MERAPAALPSLQSDQEEGPGHPVRHQGPGPCPATGQERGASGETQRGVRVRWTISLDSTLSRVASLLLGGVTSFSFF